MCCGASGQTIQKIMLDLELISRISTHVLLLELGWPDAKVPSAILSKELRHCNSLGDSRSTLPSEISQDLYSLISLLSRSCRVVTMASEAQARRRPPASIDLSSREVHHPRARSLATACLSSLVNFNRPTLPHFRHRSPSSFLASLPPLPLHLLPTTFALDVPRRHTPDVDRWARRRGPPSGQSPTVRPSSLACLFILPPSLATRRARRRYSCVRHYELAHTTPLLLLARL
jgi:hypothetical protein